MLNSYFQNLIIHFSIVISKYIVKAKAMVITESYEFDLGKTYKPYLKICFRSFTKVLLKLTVGCELMNVEAGC